MSKKFILGFSRINAVLVVGDEPAREATISPYNYQNTPKSVMKALAAGKGVTGVKIVVDGVDRFGGVCVGRTVGPDRSAVPGAPAKINLFWVTPQAQPSDPRNTYVDLDGATVNHRTDWVPISRHEYLALQAGAAFALTSGAPVAEPVVEVAPTVVFDGPTVVIDGITLPADADAAKPKGKRAHREPAAA